MFLYAFGLALIAPPLLLAVSGVFAAKQGVKALGFQVSSAAMLASVALHPLVQPYYLETQDTRQNLELRRQVESSQLLGKSEPMVAAVLGEPTVKRTENTQVFTLEGQVAWQGQTQTIWEYKPLPLYWSGKKLRVVFERGVVAEIVSLN